MNKDLSFEKFKEEALKDSFVKAEYERLRPEFEALEKRIKKRNKRDFFKHLTVDKSNKITS